MAEWYRPTDTNEDPLGISGSFGAFWADLRRTRPGLPPVTLDVTYTTLTCPVVTHG